MDVRSPSGSIRPMGANRAAPTRWRGYAEGPYGLVHYQDTGGDGAPLILCPQAPQSSRQFDTLLPELARRGVRAVAVDTPGFGMSDAPDFVPTIADYAKALPPVLDHLKIKRASFAGHHTGATIVTEMSLLFPDRVERLVLNGPSPFSDGERRDWIAYGEKFERNYVYEADGRHLLNSFQARWKWYGEGGDAQLTTRVITEKFSGYGPFWYGHNASFTYDHAASIARINHPTLILTNTGDVLYPLALVTRELRPDFAFVALEGGTIDIVDQEPAAWAEAVCAFLGAK